MITPIRFRLALSRREFTQLALLFPWFPSAPQAPANGRRVQTSSDGEPHFVDPPGEIPSSLQRRVEELGAALAAGTTSTNDVLPDPASNELRPYPLFRETIAK
ncbi:MAG: hypothetical protein HOP15_06095, partial [Planctomycetes bacterium]|nr:hypothetical protein [Planctomycetota bacterium]